MAFSTASSANRDFLMLRDQSLPPLRVTGSPYFVPLCYEYRRLLTSFITDYVPIILHQVDINRVFGIIVVHFSMMPWIAMYAGWAVLQFTRRSRPAVELVAD